MSTRQSPLAALAEWFDSSDQANGSRSFIMALAASTWTIVALMATAEVSPMTQQQAAKIGLLYVSFPLIGMYFVLRALPIFSRVFSGTVVDDAIERWLSWAKQNPLVHGFLSGAVVASLPFAYAGLWILLAGKLPDSFVGLMELIR